MTISSRRVVLLASVLAPLCAASLAAAAPGDDPSGTAGSVGSDFRRTHACGTRQEPGLLIDQGPIWHAAGPRTIYLNRFGGTYHIKRASTNSATQTANSQIVSADGQAREAVIAPMGSGFNWATISSCVQQHYAKYDVRVVETRPTSGAYVEAVVGGTGTELGFGRDQLFGIASADNFCGVTEAGIAFSFSETHRGVPQQDLELCATIAHEVGHLLALEHETLATDLMSYVLVSDTTSKAFVNQSSPCGVQPGQNQQCSCSQSSTNSAGRLTQFVGLRPVETVPPSLSVVKPGDGDELPPSFEVVADATDDNAMSDVSVLVDGSPVGSDVEPDGNRYVIDVSGVADGTHALIVQATDRAGNHKQVQLAITVARLPIGDSCTSGDQCQGGQCVTQSGDTFCTQTCDVNNDTCPDGWTCTQAGAIAVCAGGAGGCCDAGSQPGPGTGLLVLGVGFVVVRRRRRAARAA